MLKEEAQWVGRIVRSLPDDAFPLLNLGCQTAQFRRDTQPWIDQEIFAPLELGNREVVHVDIRAAEGVDLVADLTTAGGRDRLAAVGGRTMLCSNLLEHVPDVDAVVTTLRHLTPPFGYLILTGPQRYPVHPDPIDNGLRPSWQEMGERFGPWFEVIDGTRVYGRRMVHRYLATALGRGKARDASAATTRTERGLPAQLGWLASRVAWAPRRPVVFALLLQRIGR